MRRLISPVRVSTCLNQNQFQKRRSMGSPSRAKKTGSSILHSLKLFLKITFIFLGQTDDPSGVSQSLLLGHPRLRHENGNSTFPHADQLIVSSFHLHPRF